MIRRRLRLRISKERARHVVHHSDHVVHLIYCGVMFIESQGVHAYLGASMGVLGLALLFLGEA